MRCGAARKYLYRSEKLGDEETTLPVSAEVAQAEAHVERCAACQEFFAAEERVKGFVKTLAPREAASAALRERALGRIARERARPARRSRLLGFMRRRSLALALLCLLVGGLLGGVFWLRAKRARDASQQLASILVEDHTHYLSGETQVTSSDPGVVQAWFRGKVDFTFRLPPLRDPSLIGGRLCNLEGKHAALIFYRHPQSTVSLFILDGNDIELPAGRLIALDERPRLVTTLKGCNVVMWKERGLLYGLVSDIRSADLLQLSAQF